MCTNAAGFVRWQQICHHPRKAVRRRTADWDIAEDAARGKQYSIIAITEKITDTAALAKRIEEEVGVETRAVILGHPTRRSPCVVRPCARQ